MKKIAVIGSGIMGNGIAHLCIQNGFEVSLIDVSETALANGLATIEKNMDRMIKKQIISNELKESSLQRLKTFTSIENGVIACDLIIEAATENENLKLKIFKELDTYCHPDAILASNTSSISITKIASATQRPEKVIGMHFMNPVPLMELVEVIRGYSTSNEVSSKIFDLSLKLGKKPVAVNDYPGFIANRILMPMINEAITSLFEGVAGVEEIDTIMKLGMAHPMGPLQLSDFIGLDTCLSILKVLHQGFGNQKYAPCPLLVNMVAAGNLGVKSGKGFYTYESGAKIAGVSASFLK